MILLQERVHLVEVVLDSGSLEGFEDEKEVPWFERRMKSFDESEETVSEGSKDLELLGRT